MKKLAFVVAVLLLALVGWLAAGPFLTLRALSSAIERGDATGLSDHVDFPAVRSSVRAQVEDYVARRAGAEGQDSFGGALAAGLAGAVGGTAAELLATPAGVAAVMEGRAVFDHLRSGRPLETQPAPASSNPLDNADYRYESTSRFVVTAHNADGAPVVFVLTRDGLHWKVTDVRLPLESLDPLR